MRKDVNMEIIKPIPEPIPEPITKKLYIYCVHCNGTGNISLTNADLPPTEITCEWCNGEGKILFGEVEV